MSLTRLRQLSTNPCHLRQGERSSGTEFRTLSFNYRDADDQGIPQLHTRGETSSSYRGSGLGLAAALAASGAAPAFAADDPAPAPVKPAATSDRGDKLGTADAEILAKAEAKGEKNITMMVATTPGATEQVSKQLDAVEGSVLGQTYDKLGYVRASVPTKSAESTIKAASKLSSVLGIDLKQEIKLDDPTPKGDRADGAKQLKATGSYPAPGKKTPA